MDLNCGIDCASGVYAVPDGTRNFSLPFPSRHCRAGLQIVPSVRDWASLWQYNRRVGDKIGSTTGNRSAKPTFQFKFREFKTELALS